MKIRITPFVEFAYGDQRKDKATVQATLDLANKVYDPSTDRYKQFRDALSKYEEQNGSEIEFRNLHKNVTSRKKSGYKTLCENYLNLKEHYALIWTGRQPLSLNFGDLEINTAWYLRTAVQNQNTIIFLNFRKDPFPPKQERAILTILQLAALESAGAGILNIQTGTLVSAPTKDQAIVSFLKERAEKFLKIASEI